MKRPTGYWLLFPASRNENEQEVDYFAASLLMPRNAFSSQYAEACRNFTSIYEQATALQQIFETPIDSIYRRFEELKLLKVELSNG